MLIYLKIQSIQWGNRLTTHINSLWITGRDISKSLDFTTSIDNLEFNFKKDNLNDYITTNLINSTKKSTIIQERDKSYYKSFEELETIKLNEFDIVKDETIKENEIILPKVDFKNYNYLNFNNTTKVNDNIYFNEQNCNGITYVSFISLGSNIDVDELIYLRLMLNALQQMGGRDLEPEEFLNLMLKYSSGISINPIFNCKFLH